MKCTLTELIGAAVSVGVCAILLSSAQALPKVPLTNKEGSSTSSGAGIGGGDSVARMAQIHMQTLPPCLAQDEVVPFISVVRALDKTKPKDPRAALDRDNFRQSADQFASGECLMGDDKPMSEEDFRGYQGILQEYALTALSDLGNVLTELRGMGMRAQTTCSLVTKAEVESLPVYEGQKFSWMRCCKVQFCSKLKAVS